MLAAHHRGELFAVRTARLQAFQILGAALVLANRDVFHFRRDDAFARVVHLRDVLAGDRAARRAVQALEAQVGGGGIGGALAAEVARQTRQRFGVAALFDPRLTQRGQTRANVDFRFRIGVRARRIVDIDRRILLAAEAVRRVGLRDFAHRHANIGTRAGHVDLAGIGQRRDGGFIDVGVGGKKLRVGVHAYLRVSAGVDALTSHSGRLQMQCGAAKQETRRKLSEIARNEAVELGCEIRTLPCAGIIQIRFKGYFSPARHGPPTSVRRRTPALAAHTIHRLPVAWQPVLKKSASC